MTYTYIQKMSMARILLDIISIDGKIDARETSIFEKIKDYLGLSSEDHYKVRDYNSIICLCVIKEMTPDQKKDYRKLMEDIILADGIIDENELIAYDNICTFCGIDNIVLKTNAYSGASRDKI